MGRALKPTKIGQPLGMQARYAREWIFDADRLAKRPVSVLLL